MVLVGVPTTWWPLTLAGGTAVAAAVGWHAVVLLRMLRRALPARFRVTVRYYLAAAASLVVGVGFGVTLAFGWEDPWHGRLLVAHALTNVLGWLGLTLTGTLLTLWPTMLRTRMDAAAEGWTRRALPVFLTGIGVAAGGALAGVAWLSAAGVVLYLAGLALWGRGLWQPLRTKPPTEFAAASVGAALVWLVVGLAWAGWVLAASADWATIHDQFVWPAAALGAGFGVQVVTGALSYLLPSVLGGGPSVVRAGQRWFDAAAGFRLVAINGGLLLWLAPTPSCVKAAGSLLALGAAVSFLPIMIGGIRASVAARRAVASGTELQEAPMRPPVLAAGQLIAGVTAVVLAAVVGVGLDPQAAGATAGTPPTATGTGTLVRVQVEIRDMRYVPDQVSVAPGDRLVVELSNHGTTTHDLVIGSARSARIGPGRTTELDAGVLTASTQGYCSVVGHRQLGMTFQVLVTGTDSAASDAHPGHAAHPMPHASAPSAATPPSVLDPVLPALGADTVHRVTLTVAEVPLEVAPGVWQRRWTFNGRAPGPTLHGRLGDVFEVTLVNSATIGHSIDFHAGALAPDRPMRTIQPGETLVYRFTATRAGVWMYHCSTMPMTAHIAAGMFGAVVIEPDGLAPVDRSYVLVQSETYLQDRAGDPASATEVDADAVSADRPSYTAFNGVAFGYDSRPLAARVGERVRFWVLDAGPNRASSFHIVGTQFDTVYSEGGYLLRRGRDAFGTRAGGSQALALQPAQGGFVETTFNEAGRYALVSHAMVDAERGAHGFVVVQ
jgi:nitrite reductase (NO-forming)